MGERVGELVEGTMFVTRLTGKLGVIVMHSEDRGVLVKFKDRCDQCFLHPNVVVNPIETIN